MRWMHQGREEVVLFPSAGRFSREGALSAHRYSYEQRRKSGQGSQVYNKLLSEHLFGLKCYMLHWVFLWGDLVLLIFLNLINDGLDTNKIYEFQQQLKVVPLIPDLLKGGKGSWAGSTARGLSDHRLAGSMWQVAVTNTGCFLPHKQNAFCRAQDILEAFTMEVLWILNITFHFGHLSCAK